MGKIDFSLYGVSHGFVTFGAMLIGIALGVHWEAAVAMIFFYYAREEAQKELMGRETPYWVNFYPWKWSLDSQWDWYVPIIVATVMATAATIWL